MEEPWRASQTHSGARGTGGISHTGVGTADSHFPTHCLPSFIGPQTKKILQLLRLKQLNMGVFLKVREERARETGRRGRGRRPESQRRRKAATDRPASEGEGRDCG